MGWNHVARQILEAYRGHIARQADDFSENIVVVDLPPPPTDTQPLKSSIIIAHHVAPMRVVAADSSGKTTGIIQIDQDTHLWVQTDSIDELG